MNVVVVVVCIALGLSLALLAGLHRKLDGLPPRVWSIAKQERARDEGHALTALREATAAKVGSITGALRLYEEELAASSRAQVAEAEKRARIAERRLSDAGVALDAATSLVRELRAVLDELRSQTRAPAEPAAEPATAADPDQRKTIDAPPPVPSVAPQPAPGDEDSEELTTVITRPITDRGAAS